MKNLSGISTLRVSSTEFKTEECVAVLKDATFILDDLFKEKDNRTLRDYERRVRNIIRNFADNSPRTTTRSSHKNNSQIIITAEYLLESKTDVGRLMVLEVTEPIDSKKLDICQKTPLGVSSFYYHFIKWVAEKYEDIVEDIIRQFAIFRESSVNQMLDVIASELDRKYFGVKITDKFADLTKDEFIDLQFKAMQRKYNFLIFVGEGELIDGIPSVIKTRFKNRIHRSIYLEMQYRNGKGVITDCHYYDRKYKERSKVVPQMLSTVFFEYNRQAILHIVNTELNTVFTHIIFVTDGSLDIDNEVALCGNI